MEEKETILIQCQTYKQKEIGGRGGGCQKRLWVTGLQIRTRNRNNFESLIRIRNRMKSCNFKSSKQSRGRSQRRPTGSKWSIRGSIKTRKKKERKIVYFLNNSTFMYTQYSSSLLNNVLWQQVYNVRGGQGYSKEGQCWNRPVVADFCYHLKVTGSVSKRDGSGTLRLGLSRRIKTEQEEPISKVPYRTCIL